MQKRTRVVTSPIGGGLTEQDAARVLTKIENVVLKWVEELANGTLPKFEINRNAKKNKRLKLSSDKKEYFSDDDSTTCIALRPVRDSENIQHKQSQRIVQANKRYGSVVMVLRNAATLLRKGKTATQREIYYMDTNLYNNGQHHCNDAILNVCALLREPRHCIGIVASSRGFYTGRLRSRQANCGTAEWHDPRITGGTGANITSEWITHCLEIESDARFILVVEKDGMFSKLSEDHFYNRLPCIIITGQGFPPVAVRAMVQVLQNALNIPAYGLVDCGPFGLSLLLTYVYGGARMGAQGASYVSDVKWLGLRPSQLDALDLPEHVFVSQTDSDLRRAKSVLELSTINSQDDLRAEVEYWTDGGRKVELEGLHSLGIDFMSSVFLERAILRKDFLSIA